MKVAAAILAAGSGSRFGSDKTRIELGGKPLWRWSFEAFSLHPLVDEVILVASPQNLQELGCAGKAVLGGATRQASALNALKAASDADILLLHDAARPFVSRELIDRVLAATSRVGAAAPAVPIIDTIRRAGLIIDRAELRAMQTPQGARTELLRQAHAVAKEEFTDDMALVQAIGAEFELVQGEPANFKITTDSDLIRARAMVGSELRTGIGYDVHRFSPEAGRPCMIGGVRFEAPGLEGHSDADVLLHAITDALLGAAALGDIGQHFPNSDPTWRDHPSLEFLRKAGALLREQGWRISNLDATLIAEAPKIMTRATEIRAAIAAALEIGIERVSVKATTNEGLGSIGRGEGAAACAIATITKG